MKMITAIIRPWKLDDLQMAVARLGVQGITVTEVTGYGRQRGHSEHYKGSEYQVEFVPKLRVEIVLDDSFGRSRRRSHQQCVSYRQDRRRQDFPGASR